MFKRLGTALFATVVAVSALVPATAAVAQDTYYQCVRFAREFSGIQIYGDAWTWWASAQRQGLRTGRAPEAGAVLVFQPHGASTRGHVAVVSQVLTERVMRISHANWGGSRGRIERDVTVVDVSESNDWSRVRVWHNPSNDLGVSVYPTYGFIYQSDEGQMQRIAAQAQGMQATGYQIAALDSAAGQP